MSDSDESEDSDSARPRATWKIAGLMSDSDESEDSDSARRRAEILSCVVTTDEVRASGSRPPPRSDLPAREQPAYGFREHSARKLHALLDSRVRVSDGVWEKRARRAKKRLRAAPTLQPRSELRLFAHSTTIHAHAGHGAEGSAPDRAADAAGAAVDADAANLARRERKRERRESRERKRARREQKKRTKET